MSLSVRLLPLFFALAVLPVSQAFFQGCATIIDGPTQHVSVASQPQGAQVFLNGRMIGTTPASLAVSRWGFHRLRLEMPGYKPVEMPLEKEFNQNAEGNAFIGGVWIVIDAITGAIFIQDVPPKKRIDIQTRQMGTVIFSTATLTISTTLKPDPGVRQIGQLQRSF
jgi:hypothetical protein